MQIGTIAIQHGATQVHLRTYDQRLKGRLVPMGGEDDEDEFPAPKTIPFRAIPSIGPLSPPASSYASEHLRMKPVMDVVRGSEDLRPISAGFEVYADGGLAARVKWRWRHASERITGLDVYLFNGANADQVAERLKAVFDAAGIVPLACYFQTQ